MQRETFRRCSVNCKASGNIIDRLKIQPDLLNCCGMKQKKTLQLFISPFLFDMATS